MSFRSFRLIWAIAPSLMLASLMLSPSVALAMPMDGSLPIIQRPQFDPQAEFEAGSAAMIDHKYREAKEHFDHVLTVSPDHPQALYQVGLAEVNLGELRDAARDFQAALRADPNLFEASRQLALVDARLGRGDQARAQLVRLKRYAQICAQACAQASDIAAAVVEVETTLSAAPGKASGG